MAEQHRVRAVGAYLLGGKDRPTSPAPSRNEQGMQKKNWLHFPSYNTGRACFWREMLPFSPGRVPEAPSCLSTPQKKPHRGLVSSQLFCPPAHLLRTPHSPLQTLKDARREGRLRAELSDHAKEGSGRLQLLWRKYGVVGIGCYFGIYFGCTAFFYGVYDYGVMTNLPSGGAAVVEHVSGLTRRVSLPYFPLEILLFCAGTPGGALGTFTAGLLCLVVLGIELATNKTKGPQALLGGPGHPWHRSTRFARECSFVYDSPPEACKHFFVSIPPQRPRYHISNKNIILRTTNNILDTNGPIGHVSL